MECNFSRNDAISYTNCTSYTKNWTDLCCQPQSAKDMRLVAVTTLGIFIIVGIITNLITITTFVYLLMCQKRIEKKFSRRFTITNDPVFFLILNLSFSDFLYFTVGLVSHWLVYFYGYFPMPEAICKGTAMARFILGNIKLIRLQ